MRIIPTKIKAMKGTMKWCTFLFYTLWAIVTLKNYHWFQHWLNVN